MQIIFSVIAVIVRIFSNSLSNVFQKQLAENGNKPVCVNYISYLILCLLCLPFVFTIDFSSFTSTFWVFAALGGITGALGNTFIILALEKGELSILGPINSYKAIIGLIFGAIILKEYPNIFGILGIILIIIGSYVIFDTLDEKFSLKLFSRKDIQYRLFALFFSAIEAVFIKKVIVESSVLISFTVSCIMGALFSLILMKFFNLKVCKDITRLNKKDLSLYILTAACFGLVTITTAYVFKHMNVGYALSLFQLSIILSVIFGYKIFKEKNLLQKLIGSIVVLIGSTIIILLGMN